ncbi:MAG: hypothetical protein JW943_06110 [Deltaproteobacteria bacterium]|nr:hypothetical protein [Deltaproteobacteria bacterium]
MGTTAKRLFCMAAVLLMMVTPGGVCASGNADLKAVRLIVTSDSILSGMIASLLPPERYAVEAILPAGCGRGG